MHMNDDWAMTRMVGTFEQQQQKNVDLNMMACLNKEKKNT